MQQRQPRLCAVTGLEVEEGADYGSELGGIVKEGVVAATFEAYQTGFRDEFLHLFGVGKGSGGVVLSPN